MPALDPLAIALATAGALLPDIDHPASWVGRHLRVISRPLATTTGHRGVAHSLVAVLACLIFLSREGLSRVVIDPPIVGYLSHLAADLLTTSGLRQALRRRPGAYSRLTIVKQRRGIGSGQGRGFGLPKTN